MGKHKGRYDYYDMWALFQSAHVAIGVALDEAAGLLADAVDKIDRIER